ncbi:MAG: molybdopterin-guanine dinucleotide biosynthesis protein MobB, partial [Anaerolineae bacterium]
MLSVVIQAGGRSSRMGQDKALMPFLGEPLVRRVLRRLRPLADELLITTNNPQDYPPLGVRLVPDVIPDRGALGGLLTA